MSSLYESAGWIAALRDGFEYAIGEVDVSGYRLVLVVRDDLIGPRVIALPFSDYVTAPPENLLASVCGAVAAKYPDHKAVLKFAMPACDPVPAGWTGDQSAIHHSLSLGAPDALWSALSDSFRRGVRKARAADVVVRFAAEAESVERFHRLFAEHRRRKFRLLSHPRAFFERIAENFFPDCGFFAEAWRGSSMVGSYLILAAGDTLYYKLGASDLDALEYRPNNLLMWELIAKAAEDGFSNLELGMSWLSDEDAGIVKFKDALGAERRPISRLQRVPAGYPQAREDEARGVLQHVTSILTDLPMSADESDAAGGAFFRYFT